MNKFCKKCFLSKGGLCLCTLGDLVSCLCHQPINIKRDDGFMTANPQPNIPKSGECGHEWFVNELIQVCRKCGIIETQESPAEEVKEGWIKVRDKLQKTIEKYPNLAMDCIDSASVYWIEISNSQKDQAQNDVLRGLVEMEPLKRNIVSGQASGLEQEYQNGYASGYNQCLQEVQKIIKRLIK